MSQSQYVHLEDATVKRVTANAALIEFDYGDGPEQVLIPLSQIADGDDLEASAEPQTVSITEWVAKQKGIET